MDEKKIEYLKKHLEQALLDDDYNEVNSCYQELLKLLSATDIPDLAQKVNDYNKSHYKKLSQNETVSSNDIKKRIRIAKKRHKINVKIHIYGIAGGLAAMVLGCFLVMCGTGVFGNTYTFFYIIGRYCFILRKFFIMRLVIIVHFLC